jgi:hypothetical protein
MLLCTGGEASGDAEGVVRAVRVRLVTGLAASRAMRVRLRRGGSLGMASARLFGPWAFGVSSATGSDVEDTTLPPSNAVKDTSGDGGNSSFRIELSEEGVGGMDAAGMDAKRKGGAGLGAREGEREQLRETDAAGMDARRKGGAGLGAREGEGERERLRETRLCGGFGPGEGWQERDCSGATGGVFVWSNVRFAEEVTLVWTPGWGGAAASMGMESKSAPSRSMDSSFSNPPSNGKARALQSSGAAHNKSDCSQEYHKQNLL